MRVEKQNRGSLVIRLFGSLAIEDGARTLGPGDLGGARPKQVLEILLAARGHRVATDRLADLLWPVQRPRNTAGSLQTFVSTLRRHLTHDRARSRELIVTEAEAYRFATGSVDFDLDRFDGLVERSAGEPTRVARRTLEHALALVRGDLLEDEPYASWAQDLRGTYQGRVLGARMDAADAALAELDYAGALAHADAAAGLDRFSERAQRTAMLALYALGRQHEALQAYRRFCALIDCELGLEPAAQTRALHSAILRQDDVRVLLPRPIERAHRDAGERSVRLLGRAGELGTLERAARQALGGSLALLLIEGEAGLGKTRLLDELAARLDGVRVGQASCSELERHLPYVPLAAALRDALPRAELSGPHRAALRKIMPELAPADPPAELAETEVLEALVGVLAGFGVKFTPSLAASDWVEASVIAVEHPGGRAEQRRPVQLQPDVGHPLPAVGFQRAGVQPGTADRLRARRGAGRHPGPEHHTIRRRQQHLPVDRVHRELPAHQHLRQQLGRPASRQARPGHTRPRPQSEAGRPLRTGGPKPAAALAMHKRNT